MKDHPPAQDRLLSTLKVLIVEDSAEMQRLLVALFASMGIGEAVCAASGEEGLALFGRGGFDIIITDGDMRPMDGYEMTRRIRALKEVGGDEVPVLMISGHRGKEIVERARDEGVTDYIVKPVTAELLYERLLAAISRPIHLVQTNLYRGPSPTRRLTPREADVASASLHRETAQKAD